jgi:hypothetical protein
VLRYAVYATTCNSYPPHVGGFDIKSVIECLCDHYSGTFVTVEISVFWNDDSTVYVREIDVRGAVVITARICAESIRLAERFQKLNQVHFLPVKVRSPAIMFQLSGRIQGCDLDGGVSLPL